RPTGHFTLLPAPTFSFHAGLTAARYSVNTAVVPLPSLRYTTAMSSSGNATPGLCSVIRGSFHFFASPRKIAASASGVSFSGALDPSRLYVTTTEPIAVGTWVILPGAPSASDGRIGASLAPK